MEKKWHSSRQGEKENLLQFPIVLQSFNVWKAKNRMKMEFFSFFSTVTVFDMMLAAKGKCMVSVTLSVERC
jgi:hypothetical protein